MKVKTKEQRENTTFLSTPLTGMARFKDDASAQMTVEFVIMFPIMLIVACVALNALLFFSECAAFDRMLRTSVNIQATSPASYQGDWSALSTINSDLEVFNEKDYLSYELHTTQHSGGLTEFQGILFFTPTLFGAGPVDSIFGVAFPQLIHSSSIVVEVHQTGIGI